MKNYYFPIIYIVPLISVDGQTSPRLFIAPEIRKEETSYRIAKIYSGYKMILKGSVLGPLLFSDFLEISSLRSGYLQIAFI